MQVREKCRKPLAEACSDCDCECQGRGYTYRWITQEEWVKSLKGDALHLLANRLQGMSTREALKR